MRPCISVLKGLGFGHMSLSINQRDILKVSYLVIPGGKVSADALSTVEIYRSILCLTLRNHGHYMYYGFRRIMITITAFSYRMGAV